MHTRLHTMKLALRKSANALLCCVPKPLTRYLLKSIWYQSALQDALRYHVLPYGYGSTIPTRFDINPERLKKRRNLPGIQLDDQRFLSLLEQLVPFAAELRQFPLQRAADAEFWFRNGGYEDLDATSLYCMIRKFKPRRIVEAGCGFSSRVISLACRRNQAEGHPAECIFIEPYPSDRILTSKLAGELLVKKIEEVPLETFQNLQAGDIFFIDTSHVIKTQNDCCYEYLQIIPSLSAGVLLHVHDIYTPYDYPEELITELLNGWNEQYVLECLLTHNPRMEVLLPVFYLWTDYPTQTGRLFPPPSGRPGAIWLQTKEPSPKSEVG